jgi:hypothetical protein
MNETTPDDAHSRIKGYDAKREKREYELRWYQARLGFWQAICVTLITGGLAVAIPGMVEVYKNHQATKLKQLELELKEKENEGKRIEFDQQYVSNFLATALVPDVETRIRLGQYFSFVASEKYRQGWAKYFEAIEARRNAIRDEINSKQQELQQLRARTTLNADEVSRLDRLQRELRWRNSELGYE